MCVCVSIEGAALWSALTAPTGGQCNHNCEWDEGMTRQLWCDKAALLRLTTLVWHCPTKGKALLATHSSRTSENIIHLARANDIWRVLIA